MSHLPEDADNGNKRPHEKFYPYAPGFKAEGPSRDAAEAIAPTAKQLRARVLKCLTETSGGLTADEIAAKLNHSTLGVRPRLSELKERGMIAASGDRRKNASGMNASVWVATPAAGSAGGAV